MANPVSFYSDANVTDTFGDTAPVLDASGNNLRLQPHQGVDYAAPLGADIPSITSGTVVGVGFDESLGNFVKVLTQLPGAASAVPAYVIYGHMTAQSVQPGDVVNRGDTLGTVGVTGMSNGPHVHVGILDANGVPNPLVQSIIDFFNAPETGGAMSAPIIPIVGGVGITQGATNAVQGAAGAASSVVDGAKSTADAVASVASDVGKLAAWMGKSGHWWSIGFVLAGVFMIGLGAAAYFHSDIQESGEKAAEVAAVA